MAKKRMDHMDEIIHKMNKLAVEMDEVAASIHPTARREVCKPMALKWLELNRQLNKI